MPTEPSDHTDITLATEVTDGLPGSLMDGGGSGARRPEEDRTVFVDPVEQAILVDRTRQPPHAPLSAAARSMPGHATVFTMTGETGNDGGNETGSAILDPDSADIPLPPPIEPGPPDEALFGNYRVVAPLASGELGPVFLAEHRSMGFPVVIRVLQPALVGMPEAEKRFFAQAVVASRIAHPGVAMVLDYGYDQRGIAYLATEYLEGETLAAHLAAGSLFSLEQVIDIGAQVAATLAAAHESGVLHRDIRAENVHIGADMDSPSGLRVKLLDFGLPGPDQVPSIAGAGERADIYGLGCVLYRLLAGRPPFAADSAGAPMQDPPPPRTHRPDIPPPLDRLVHRMVAHRPQSRPSSMVEIEETLRALIPDHERPDAAPPSAPPPGWRATWELVRAHGLQAMAEMRETALRHPRMSVACIAAALFVGAIGLALILA
jgi:hypothetical protein